MNEICIICGAVEGLVQDEDIYGKRVWVCEIGDCGREWERDQRDEYQAEYERELEDLEARYWRW